MDFTRGVCCCPIPVGATTAGIWMAGADDGVGFGLEGGDVFVVGQDVCLVKVVEGRSQAARAMMRVPRLRRRGAGELPGGWCGRRGRRRGTGATASHAKEDREAHDDPIFKHFRFSASFGKYQTLTLALSQRERGRSISRVMLRRTRPPAGRPERLGGNSPSQVSSGRRDLPSGLARRAGPAEGHALFRTEPGGGKLRGDGDAGGEHEAPGLWKR